MTLSWRWYQLMRQEGKLIALLNGLLFSWFCICICICQCFMTNIKSVGFHKTFFSKAFVYCFLLAGSYKVCKCRHQKLENHWSSTQKYKKYCRENHNLRTIVQKSRHTHTCLKNKKSQYTRTFLSQKSQHMCKNHNICILWSRRKKWGSPFYDFLPKNAFFLTMALIRMEKVMEGNVNRECWPEATFCKLIYIFVDSLPTNLLSTSCWYIVFVDSRTGAKNWHLRWMLHRGAISGRDGNLGLLTQQCWAWF